MKNWLKKIRELIAKIREFLADVYGHSGHDEIDELGAFRWFNEDWY